MGKATPTDDLDDLIALGPQPGAKECRTGWALVNLPPDVAAKFRQAMGINASPSRLAVAFAARGFDVGVQSIRRHNAGGCRNCPDRAA